MGGRCGVYTQRLRGQQVERIMHNKMRIIAGGAKVGPSDIAEGLEKSSKEKMLRVRSKQ